MLDTRVLFSSNHKSLTPRRYNIKSASRLQIFVQFCTLKKWNLNLLHSLNVTINIPLWIRSILHLWNFPETRKSIRNIYRLKQAIERRVVRSIRHDVSAWVESEEEPTRQKTIDKRRKKFPWTWFTFRVNRRAQRVARAKRDWRDGTSG